MSTHFNIFTIPLFFSFLIQIWSKGHTHPAISPSYSPRAPFLHLWKIDTLCQRPDEHFLRLWLDLPTEWQGWFHRIHGSYWKEPGINRRISGAQRTKRKRQRGRHKEGKKKALNFHSFYHKRIAKLMISPLHVLDFGTVAIQEALPPWRDRRGWEAAISQRIRVSQNTSFIGWVSRSRSLETSLNMSFSCDYRARSMTSEAGMAKEDILRRMDEDRERVWSEQYR